MNTAGIPRLTFVVDDVLNRLRAHGAELVGEAAQYGDIYRYYYVRGPGRHHHRAGRGIGSFSAVENSSDLQKDRPLLSRLLKAGRPGTA